MFKRFRMKFTYRYVINDGAVICFAEPAMENDELKRYTALYIGLRGEKPKNTINVEYKGIARLKKGDNSDIETAKAIARAKAVRAAFKAFRVLTNEITEAIYREYADCFDFGTTISKKIADVQTDIDELIAP